jgi:hypothetical protein
MDQLWREHEPLIGGIFLSALLFAVREVVGGGLRSVGEDLWKAVRRRHDDRADHTDDTQRPP